MFTQEFIYFGIFICCFGFKGLLKVYYRALETNGPFVFQEQQVLKQLSGFIRTMVVNVFIDLTDHPMPQGPQPPSKKLSGCFYGFLVLFRSPNVYIHLCGKRYMSGQICSKK